LQQKSITKQVKKNKRELEVTITTINDTKFTVHMYSNSVLSE